MPGHRGSEDFLCRQADMWSFAHSCLDSGSGEEEVIPKKSDMTQASLPNPTLTPKRTARVRNSYLLETKGSQLLRADLFSMLAPLVSPRGPLPSS